MTIPLILTTMLTAFNEFLWQTLIPLLAVIVLIWLPFRLGARPILKFSLLRSAFKQLLLPQKETFGLGVTPRAGFFMSLAITMSAGNFIGTILLVGIGGYGVLLYIWLFTLLLLGIKYIETVQAILYRKVNIFGQFCGGPMYVLKYGLGKNIAWLGSFLTLFYCLFLVLGGIGVGNHLPVRFIQQLGQDYFFVNPINALIAITAIVGLGLLFGARMIAGLVSVFMFFVLALLGASFIYMMVFHGGNLSEFFLKIFTEATQNRSAQTGASLPTIIFLGFIGALYGTGTGWGISTIAHSAVVTYDARQQGHIAVIAHLVSGILVSFLIGFIAYLSGSLDVRGETILQLVQSFAFLDDFGHELIIGTIILLCLSAILTWGYYVEVVGFFLFGKRAIWWVRSFWLLLLPLAFLTRDIGFAYFHEVALGLVAIPSFIAIVAVLANVREIEHLNNPKKVSSYLRKFYRKLRTLKRILF